MTSPEDHQTGLQKAATGPKDQLQPERIFQKVPIKPKAPDHLKNTITKAAAKNARFLKAALTSRQAALPAVKRNRSRQKAGHIPVAHPTMQLVRENRFLKAGHIPAELPTAAIARPKVLAVKDRAIKNLFHHALNRHQVHLTQMTVRKETSAAKERATKSLSHRAANPQQALTIPTKNRKEVSAEIENIPPAQPPAAALKALPINHIILIVPRVHGITTAKQSHRKLCVAVNPKGVAPMTA